MSATFFSSRPEGGEDGRYAEGYTDGWWLLLLIPPRVVLAADWWEWWERDGEEVFKERLSGVEWLSYGVGWRLETSRAALLRLHEWWDWILHLGPRQGGVGGRNALYCNRSCLLWGGDLPASQKVHFFCVSYPLLCSFMVFLSWSFFFCPASSSPIMLTLPKIFSSCPLKIIKLSIQCRSIRCQHHFPSPVLFICSSFMINDTEQQWGGADPEKEKLHLKCTLFKVNMRNAFFPPHPLHSFCSLFVAAQNLPRIPHTRAAIHTLSRLPPDQQPDRAKM